MARSKTSKSSTTIDSAILQLASDKLKSSGLTLEDAKLLGIELLSREQTSQLNPSFRPLMSLKFRYFGTKGEPMSDSPGRNPFYRIRYLEQSTDFSGLVERKSPRYVQEPDTTPGPYLPKFCDWKSLSAESGRPLIVTEGELKAALACKLGFPAIGLGGVHSWRALKKGVELLPELLLFNWVKRYVYICFDSDFRTNPNVCNALIELSEDLHRRGAYCHLVSLPDLDNLEKVGLDDYLVAMKNAATDRLNQLLHEAEPIGLTKPLFALNDRYSYVKDPGLIINRQTGTKISPNAFKDHLEAGANYQERVVRPDGTVSYKAVSAAAHWIKWPLRFSVEKLTYSPGQPRIVDDCFNVWKGWGVEQKKGDVKPFFKLVDHLFTGAEPTAKEWFLRWCAYPLQHPGVKLFSTVLLHGVEQGTGKSLVAYTLGQIYGENFTEIKQMDLYSGFNDWAEARQLILGDDITGSNNRQDADLLKKLITQKKIRINIKYVPGYEVPDCINYFFTSNQPDAFFLEDKDRRSFIHEVTVGALSDDFYVDYDLWLNTGGAAAVFHYLLNLDLGDFNPAGKAYRTNAKERMIDNTRSDLATWVRRLIEVPDAVLRVGDIKITKDLFTSRELLHLYDPAGKTGTTANGLARELRRAGVKQVCEGLPVKLADGDQGRFYIIRHVDKWIKSTSAVVAKHVFDWSTKNIGKKY